MSCVYVNSGSVIVHKLCKCSYVLPLYVKRWCSAQERMCVMCKKVCICVSCVGNLVGVCHTGV